MPGTLRTSAALCLLSVLLLLLSIIPLENINAQRSQSRARSTPSSRAPGPNMCKVRHVLGTNDKFAVNCMADHLNVICERPTYERWECCSGYFQKGRETGCTGELPLVNLFNTSMNAKLVNFHTIVSRTKMADDLVWKGAYTVFAPSNKAIAAARGAVNQQLRQKDGTLIKYHVVPGRINMTSFRGRNVGFATLDKGNTLRINKYPFGISTVNCARVLRPDALATNGILHVIDKVLHPSDVNVSLAHRIYANPRLTLFQRALNTSGMSRRLRRRNAAYTVLVPTDRAFKRLPKATRERILNDRDTAQRVIKRHIVKGVYCANAIVVSIGLRTLEKTRLLFRCKRDGMHVNEAKLVDKDILGKNGVLHTIDTVLLPDSVKPLGQLLDDMQLNRFHKLVKEAGLNQMLQCGDGNITLFTPTNYALGQLTSGYVSRLRRDKEKLQKMLNYHIVPGRIYENSLVGETSLDTKAGIDAKIKVNVYRNGIRLDMAELRSRPRECQSAVIHKVDQVLIPPEQSLMEMLQHDSSLSVFTGMLNKTLATWDLEPLGGYTLLAPNNRAFGFLDSRGVKSIVDNPTRLKRFVQRHFIKRMVLKASIPKKESYSIKSMQGDETEFSYNTHKYMVINTHARVLSQDKMASNGVMFRIDHVLPCSCESRLRTVRGQYLKSKSYRRVY